MHRGARICDWNKHTSSAARSLAFNSGSQGKREVISGERKIGNFKMLQRRYKVINLALPQDRAGTDGVDPIFNFPSFIF